MESVLFECNYVWIECLMAIRNLAIVYAFH